MTRAIIKPRKKFCISCPDYRAGLYGLDALNLHRNVLGSNLYRIIDKNKFCVSSVSHRKFRVGTLFYCS